MNKIVKPKKYSASLAPKSEYRRDGKRPYRHVSIRSNSLEDILKWLNKIEDRKFDKRFPWQAAYIFKNEGLNGALFSFSFKY